jgi:FMN phosphatase YigB (HAD superfamily)
MPFVKRDESGRVIALFREKDPEAGEYLPPHHDDVRTFVEAAEAGRDADAAFYRSDQSMIRVYEDLLDVLIEKRAVLLTDLPVPAQQKLLNRKRLRNELTTIGEVLSDEADGIL